MIRSARTDRARVAFAPPRRARARERERETSIDVPVPIAVASGAVCRRRRRRRGGGDQIGRPVGPEGGSPCFES